QRRPVRHLTNPRLSARQLLQLDLAVELDVEFQPRDLERHDSGKCLRAGDSALGDRLGNRVLDLTLRADANHFEKLADAQIEGIFVHRFLLAAIAALIGPRADRSYFSEEGNKNGARSHCDRRPRHRATTLSGALPSED